MRLEFESVKFKNFMSFGSKWQEIQFAPGINVVLGKNGTGKSSCMETIPFALFGKTHKEVKKDDLINWKNRKALEVQLAFSKGEDKYNILRSIKPNNLEIYKNEELLPKPSHVKEYQAQLEDIISTNFQTFMSLIHCNINSSQPIFGMSKPDKRKFIEEVFGLSVYSDLNDEANKRINTVNNKLREMSLKTESNKASISDARGRITQFTKKMRALKSSQPRLNDAIERKKDIPLIDEKEIKSLKVSMDKRDKKLNDLDVLLRKCEDKKIYIASNVKSISKSIPEEQESPNYKHSVNKYKEMLEKVIEKRSALTKEFNDLEYRASHLSIEHDKLLSRMTKLKDGGECPLCGQNVGPEVSDHIKKELDRIKNEIEETDNKRRQTTRKLEEFDGKYEELSSIIDELETYNSNEKERRELTSNLDRWKRVYVKMSDYVENLKSVRTDVEKQYTLIKEKVDADMIEHNKTEKIDAEIEALKEKVKLEESTRKEFQVLVSADKDNISKLNKENEKHEKNTEKLNDLRDYMEYIKVICKDENIKAYAIKSILPMLTKNTNRYLSEIGHPFYIQLDSWLEPTIKGAGVSSGSYNSLSSGESKAVDLSLQNAFFDIARIQAGTFPDITILDELLDSSVDSDSLDVLLQMVKNKQQEDRSKVYIISHRETITDIEANNVLTLYKEGGYSKIQHV